MSMVERHHDAEAINRILNDPAVRPDVADAAEGVLDISAAVANPANVLLMGDHGGMMFFKLMAGFYEVHTQFLPAGRGAWGSSFAVAAGEWLYCHTDAIEIMTRVPHGHPAAKALTLASGFRYRWTRPANTRFRGQVVDVDIYSHVIEDWALRTSGLAEAGAAFHDRLHGFAAERHIDGPTHPDDPNHNAFVGACIALAEGGQLVKAVALYNKWALVSRHRPVEIVSLDPARVRFDIGTMVVRNGKVEIEP